MIKRKETINQDVIRKGKNKSDVLQYILVGAEIKTIFESCVYFEVLSFIVKHLLIPHLIMTF